MRALERRMRRLQSSTPAASGSPTTTSCKAATRKHVTSSNVSSICEIRLVCSQREYEVHLQRQIVHVCYLEAETKARICAVAGRTATDIKGQRRPSSIRTRPASERGSSE